MKILTAGSGTKYLLVRVRVPARVLVPVLVIALVAAGCGQAEFDRSAAIASFAAANPEATTSQSECVVDLLVERYGTEQLRVELEADPQDPDFTETQFRDMFTCGVEGDVRQQIVEQLEANEVDESDAPCVADALMADLDDGDIDVLLSGDITDAFFAKFLSAMESCGAINS